MEFSFKIKVNAKKEEVWKYYSDIEKWYIWEEDLKNISLNGKFQTGTEGIMELEKITYEIYFNFGKRKCGILG